MAFEDKSLEMAKRLKQLRKENRFSHEKLRTELVKYGIEISKDSLINYEVTDPFHTKAYSNNGMKVEYLRVLADFYHVSTDYLLGLANDPTPDPTTQSVCNYTGLSGATVKSLHLLEDGSIQRSFITRFLDDLLADCDTANIIADCLKKYAYAQKLASWQKTSLIERKVHTNGLPIFEKGEYKIPASDAADLYYSQAIAEAQGAIEQIIKQIAEEILRPYHIGKPDSESIDNFRWQIYSEGE